MGLETGKDVAIAFALVIAAGLSTALGASVVFFPRLVKLANRKTLAAGLGLSAGVMTYVSFVEIFIKSVDSFQDAGFEENKAYAYATLCFFGGVICMVLLNILVHNLLGFHHSHDHPNQGKHSSTQELSGTDNNNPLDTGASPPNEEKEEDDEQSETELPVPPCCNPDPAHQLDEIQHMAHVIEEAEEKEGEYTGLAQNTEPEAVVPVPPTVQFAEEGKIDDTNDIEAAEDAEDEAEKQRISKMEAKKLAHMSLNTAIAIALHNFPEGLATFVATLHDPAVGAVLAIAIAIHNIPEGLCVAMPVYYATGNRWRAFSWALLSGLSEPVAAFLGWIVLASSFSDTLYAVLFGMVAGMMVIISVRELLPTAHRYDPEDKVVTFSFMGGMAIMALSLVLFLL